MATPSNTSGELVDPCAEFGPYQRRAVIWFIAVIIGGVGLVIQFASIDSWMYKNNADFMDWIAYKENRVASTTLASERSDPRGLGDLSSAIGTDPNADSK